MPLADSKILYYHLNNRRAGTGDLSQTMERARESNAVFVDAWDALNSGSAGFESCRGGLVEVSWGGVPVVFFNLAVTARTPSSAGEFEVAALDTSAWTAARTLPWLFAVCHETMGELMPEAGRTLERLGLAPMMALTGMAAEEVSPPHREPPAGRCRTESDAQAPDLMLRLNEAAYQMPLGESGSLAMERPGWWAPPRRMATVLEAEGRPAGCAAVVDVGGLRYVALVATHPDLRRRGYADAAMRDVLARSLAAGLGPRTYLHATEAGRPVYERMGYTATAEYTVYGKHE